MRTTQAPTDAAAGKAWDRIMAIARDHALVIEAYGGVATLAMPDEQRKAGIRAQVLATHCMTEGDEAQLTLDAEAP